MANDQLILLTRIDDNIVAGLTQISESLNGFGKTVQKTEQQMKGFSGGLMSVGFFLLFTVGMLKKQIVALAESSLRMFSQMDRGMTPLGQTAAWLLSIFDVFKFKIGEIIARVLSPFKSNIDDIVDSVLTWIENNDTLLAGFGTAGIAIAGLAVALAGFILLMSGVGFVVGAIITLILLFIGIVIGFFVQAKLEGESTSDAIKTAFWKTFVLLIELFLRFVNFVAKMLVKLSNFVVSIPMTWLVAFLKSLQGIVSHVGAFVKSVVDFMQPLTDVFTSIATFLFNAFKGAFNGVKDGFESMINFLIRGFNSFVSHLPEGVKRWLNLSSIGEISLGALTIPDLPSLTGSDISSGLKDNVDSNVQVYIDMTNALVTNNEEFQETISKAIDDAFKTVDEKIVSVGKGLRE